MPGTFRTLRFYHNAMQQVAQKHGLTLTRSYESMDNAGTMRSATILLPNGCPVGPDQTRTPEALDHFLTLIMPAVREQAKGMVAVA